MSLIHVSDPLLLEDKRRKRRSFVRPQVYILPKRGRFRYRVILYRIIPLCPVWVRSDPRACCGPSRATYTAVQGHIPAPNRMCIQPFFPLFPFPFIFFSLFYFLIGFFFGCLPRGTRSIRGPRVVSPTFKGPDKNRFDSNVLTG